MLNRSVFMNQVLKLLILLPVMCLLNVARAQVSGRIVGVVTDQTQAVIPGAIVHLRNEATSAKQTVTTDSGGNYAFPIVAVGTYALDVDAPDFKPFKRTGIVVNIGSSFQLDAP